MSRVKLWIILALLLHILSFDLMLRKVEPFYSNFYTFAWWTYIVIASSVNQIKGRNSLLFDRPREAVWVILFSVPLWLLFEIFDFRLDNWNYLSVPLATYIRWPGYFVAFATVLPGLFETETLLKNLGLGCRLTGWRIRVSPGLLIRMVVLGLVMIVGSVAFPRVMFPFVWLGFIFLLDPLLYWSSRRSASLSAQVGQGDYTLLVRLLLAGLVCGLLWEFWNFWAGSKWVYSVPKFAFFKMFEMPALGFLGFPPFALECYLSYQLFALFRDRYVSGRILAEVLLAIVGLIYCVLVFMGIDRHNVWTYSV